MNTCLLFQMVKDESLDADEYGDDDLDEDGDEGLWLCGCVRLCHREQGRPDAMHVCPLAAAA